MELQEQLCEVCEKEKPNVKRRTFKLPMVKIIKSQSEMCDDCAVGMKEFMESKITPGMESK